MALELTYLNPPDVPVEVEGVTPDRLQQMGLDEIRKLPVFIGNEEAPLGDLFRVSGDPTDGCHRWHGDLTGVHWIGAKMQSGLIEITGSAGRHIGSEMSGGEIVVTGDVAGWVGAEMKAGKIHVRGNAGHLVGAAYRGSQRGMAGGTIMIDGNVGNELGHTMRRGLIVVGGDAGDLIGFNMLAGTILVFGATGIRHGAGMRRGTIGLLGADLPELLPSFRYACRFRPLAIRMILQNLESSGFQVPAGLRDAEVDLYSGDFIEGGRGEMLLAATDQ